MATQHMVIHPELRFIAEWVGLAFGLWLVFTAWLDRFRVPGAVAVAAAASWPFAALFLWFHSSGGGSCDSRRRAGQARRSR